MRRAVGRFLVIAWALALLAAKGHTDGPLDPRPPIPESENHTDGCVVLDADEVDQLEAFRESVTWVQLSYPRFEVFIDSAYYEHNTPLIDEFCDQIEPRYAILEAATRWRAEDLLDPHEAKKLEVYIYDIGQACYNGFATPAEAWVGLSDPIYESHCAKAYFQDGVPQYGNPGPLGDWWPYMGIAIHEILHAIHPTPFYVRQWLAEGWGSYYQYNVLAATGDINQETADQYLYIGHGEYNWAGYVANDYHDTSRRQAEIQDSEGYYITAWMLSMLRDDYGLVWDRFYEIMENNRETFFSTGPFLPTSPRLPVDMCILDFLAKALEIDFETGIKPIFRYDGPEGPGWGVRRWAALDWYADLVPTLKLSGCTPNVGDTIVLNAEIVNHGDVSLRDVVVRLYDDGILLDEQIMDVDSQSVASIAILYSAPEGNHLISLTADEENLKVETDDSNNRDSGYVLFGVCGEADLDGDCVHDLCDNCVALATPGNVGIETGDANFDSSVTLMDVIYLVEYAFKSGAAPQPIPEAGDVNCDGLGNSADIIRLANYVFRQIAEPCDVCAASP